MASTRGVEGALPAMVLGRLSADPKADPDRDMLVLAALDGPEALASYLDNHAEPRKPEQAPTEAQPGREPLGAYLKAITVCCISRKSPWWISR
jgi:hypothetical protein